MELWLSAAELPQELNLSAAELSQKLNEALNSIPNLKESVPTHSIITSKTSSMRPLGVARKAVTNTHTSADNFDVSASSNLSISACQASYHIVT